VLAPAPTGAQQWGLDQQSELYGYQNVFLPRRDSTLNNGPSGMTLAYGTRSFGVNLDWSYIVGNLQVERSPSASVGPIVAGELVALKFAGGGYLVHESRTFGVNLGWSSSPSYQWRLMRKPFSSGNDLEGQPLLKSDFVALYNTVQNNYLVYADRNVGINLGWFAEPTPPTPPQEIRKDLSMTSQVVGQRLLWTGTVGGSFDHGYIESVQINPQFQNAAIVGAFFLKDSATGPLQCTTSDSANGVYVARGAFMTEAQKMALWGTSMPSVPRTFRACADMGTVVVTPPPTLEVTVTWMSQ
jgi:hypothetical protein